MWACVYWSKMLHVYKEHDSDLVSLRLKSLENLFEAVQARLTHPIQRVGSLDLAEVGSPIAARGIKDICLAVHILDHEVLPLESNATEFIWEQDPDIC